MTIYFLTGDKLDKAALRSAMDHCRANSVSGAADMRDQPFPWTCATLDPLESGDQGKAACRCNATPDRPGCSSLIMIWDGSSEEIFLGTPEAGSHCFVSASAPIREMLGAIYDLAETEKDLTDDANSSRTMEANAIPLSSVPVLSVRETEILSHLAVGNTNKQIARQLSIAEETVKVHVKTILRKLHLVNRTQAAVWAMQHGLDAGSSHPNVDDGDFGS